MAFKFTLFASGLCLLATSCMKAQDSGADALDTVGNETSASYNKMRDYLDLGHRTRTATVRAPQDRYCYRTYQDVICYAQPIPGEEYRLTGFQNGDGTGYVLPRSTPGGGDEPLPPLARVTVETPPVIKGDVEVKKENGQLKEIIFDPSELEPKELVPEKPQ